MRNRVCENTLFTVVEGDDESWSLLRYHSQRALLHLIADNRVIHYRLQITVYMYWNPRSKVCAGRILPTHHINRAYVRTS